MEKKTETERGEGPKGSMRHEKSIDLREKDRLTSHGRTFRTSQRMKRFRQISLRTSLEKNWASEDERGSLFRQRVVVHTLSDPSRRATVCWS